jgi:LmbE family N-acetylglucosaminyl deacetylase
MSTPHQQGATLYLLAHHDDEVFCAGSLWADLRAGREVRLLEGQRVARLLNVPAGSAVGLGWPDQDAPNRLAAILEAAEWLAAGGDVGAAAPADTVRVPAFEGGHPDHDAMNMVACRLRAGHSGLLVEEFAMYCRSRTAPAVKAPWPGVRAAPLAPAARTLRRRLMTANASQLLPSLLPLAALGAAQRTWQTEPTRELPAYDYARAPLDERPLYELYTRWEFSRFAAATAAFCP